MNRYHLLLPVLFLSGCASFAPPKNWTKADTRRQIAYSTLLAFDATTTARIGERPDLIEGNPVTRAVIGSRPEPTETYAAAALLGLANYWIARRMKPERRRILHFAGIGTHVHAVRQNCDNQLC